MNRVDNITIISTGGTFNKIYNPINGELIVDSKAKAIRDIIKASKYNIELIPLFAKDSLDMTKEDRKKVAKAIKEQKNRKIIIVHGTDTIDKSAKYLANCLKKHQIVLTGAMLPFSINPIEATANLSLALGWIIDNEKDGVFIAMHGLVLPHQNIIKNKKQGIFIKR